MSVVGIELAKAFGFENLDKDSLKAKFDPMIQQTKEAVNEFYPICLEARAEGSDINCEEFKSKEDELLKQAEDESYRLEEHVGQAQSQAYETPDYEENNGDVQLYFEEDTSPTPGDESNSVNESNTDDSNGTQPEDIHSSQDDSSNGNQPQDTPEESHSSSDEMQSDSQ
jgi:hypothetical protein